MVQVNVLGGFDNVTFPMGWTDQLVTNPGVGASLESSGAGSFGGVATPSNNSYLAWSMPPEEAAATLTVVTTVGYLTRVIASTGGAMGHLDVVFNTAGTTTNVIYGIYSGASFATGPLAWTADVHASVVAGLNSFTWNGASSPASVNLVAGNTYWIYTEVTTSAAPTIAGATNAGAQAAALLNANLTASASYANNALSLAAAAPTTLAANTTLTPQTSWVNSALKFWYGLRA